MQFPDEVFDLVFCSWSIKNFMEPIKVLNEMYRVLKPGGTALVVDEAYAKPQELQFIPPISGILEKLATRRTKTTSNGSSER
jgi:ubiquinone/menaquinone biosynthesis C-methylase UbiE